MPIRSATTEEFPCAILPNGPECTRTGVFSSVCNRFGRMASFMITVIAPPALSSSAVTGSPDGVYPTTIRPSLERMSWSDVDRASTAIASDAAVMSNPVCLGTPSAAAPRPITMLRSARSLTSSTRRQVMLCWSMPSLFPWCRWLSSIAESMLCAAVTACMSPVRCRLSVSNGTTWLYPPPAAPPLIPNVGPIEACRIEIVARLPMCRIAWPRPTVVVVLPSPSGVGVTAVTTTYLAFGRSASSSIAFRSIFATFSPYGCTSHGGRPMSSATSAIGFSVAPRAISKAVGIGIYWSSLSVELSGAGAPPPRRRESRRRIDDRLWLGEGLHRIAAADPAAPADAASATAERQVRFPQIRRRVDVDPAGPGPLGEREPTLQVAREDGGRQAERRRVGQLERLLRRRHLDDRHNRPECLLSLDRHPRRHAVQHGRLREQPGTKTWCPVPASADPRPGGDRVGDMPVELGGRGLVIQRPHRRLRVIRVTEPHPCLRCFNDPLRELRADSRMYQEPLASRAALPRAQVGGLERGICREFEVGVIEYDH